MLKNYIILIGVLALMVGCVTAPQKVVLNSRFDAEQTQEMLLKGDNTITGSALIRQQGGGVVTCAGNEVWLAPVTPYSTERVKHIYGSTTKGYSDSSKSIICSLISNL